MGFACAKGPDPGNAANPSTPATPSPSPTVDVGGSTVLKEPGDTSPEQFAGTAGIVEVKRPNIHPAQLRKIRTGQHPTFDRVVFEFDGGSVPGYRVEYVDKPIRSCGAGEIVQIGGYGFLLVQMSPAQAHTEEGQPTIETRDFAPDLAVLKELKSLCDFEANVQWVMGLSSPNRYRVLELTNPARLVIDVRK